MFKRILSKLRRFRKEEQGNAALIYALAAVPIFALAGGTIDIARMYEAKARLQTALDSATLAATQSGATDETQLREIVKKYFQGNFRRKGVLEFDLDQDLSLDLQSNQGKYVLKTKLNYRYKSLFFSLIYKGHTEDKVKAEARHGIGGFEIVLVLDNTGSMEGSKMTELKNAASTMITDIAEAARDVQLERAHVGIVPYNVYVNVGKDKLYESWIDRSNLGWWAWSWKGLVGMRSEPRDVIDGEYDIEGIPAVFNTFWYVNGNQWLAPSKCIKRVGNRCVAEEPAIIPEIEPLKNITDSNNETDLKNKIQAMEPFSGTNIPLGLVWGWRLLSPEAPYTEALSKQEAKKKNVRKVIVLMTDGWNSCFSENLDGYVSCRGGLGPVASEADERMRKLCTNIKQAGIGIVTVGYDVPVGSSTEELLEECQNMGYYRADIGDLVDIFEQIANDITRLHLSG